MSQCSQCGVDSSPGMRYCGHCGAFQGEPCASCGLLNPSHFRFCGRCGVALDVVREGPPQVRRSASRHALTPSAPERRRLSILFCDMANSTAMLEALGGERWRDLLVPYQHKCARAIIAHGGRVSRFFGDGILAVFGYPESTEHDAERAVRAARAVLGEVDRLDETLARPMHTRLQVRIGIATGDVLVGDIIGEGPAEEEAVIGETVHLAARLQSEAHPQSIAIDGATRADVGGLFDFSVGGVRELKGFSEPVAVWRVGAPLEVESRFRATRGHLVPLVGRDTELGLIERAWACSLEGHGQVMLLGGEPGIGKSRLVDAFIERAQGQVSNRLAYQGSPLHANSALFPVVEQVRRIAGIVEGTDDTERLRRLREAFADTAASEPFALALLADLIGARRPVEVDADALDGLDSETRRRETLAVLVALVDSLSRRGALLVVFEDAQWLDPSSRELLRLLVPAVAHLRVLVLITHRNEYRSDWGAREHVTHVSVAPLSSDAVRQFVGQMPGAEALDAALREEVANRTDGVPLFIEALVTSLVETASVSAEGRPRRGAPSRDRPIPATVQASLIGRLDRLPEARTVIQFASVVGRDFSRALVAEAVGTAADAVDLAIARAESANIIDSIEPGAAGPVYRFQHALFQDAVYASLLSEQRRHLHARVAAALERIEPQLCAERPELLAHHLIAAGESARAIAPLLSAGKKAVGLSQNEEAIAHLTRALRLLARVPDSESRRRSELQALVTRGPALIMTRGPGRPAVRRNYDRALTLCEGLEDPDLEFAAYWGSLRVDESYPSKLARVDGLQRLAERLHDPGILLQAHHRQWATLFHMTRLEECEAHVHRGLAIYDEGDYRDHGMRYAGHDPKVCGHGELALASWLRGQGSAAMQQIEHALGWAAEIDHVGSTAHALDIATMLARYRRDVRALEGHAQAMLELAVRAGLVDHASKARLFLGWAQAVSGKVVEGLAALEREMEHQERHNTPEDFPVFYESLVEALGLAGRTERAVAVSERAAHVAERAGITYWNPELCRRRAELMRNAGEPESVTRWWFEKALEEAGALGLSTLARRAALGLAHLHAEHGRDADARRVLEPFMTGAADDPDVELRAVRRLLESL